MLALPMPELSLKESEKYWNVILSMCHAPAKKYGHRVVLIRNIGSVKKGTIGIARPFNPLDIYKLQKEVNRDIEWIAINGRSFGGTRSLLEAFDFFPITFEDGKEKVRVNHCHINRFDFKYILSLSL